MDPDQIGLPDHARLGASQVRDLITAELRNSFLAVPPWSYYASARQEASYAAGPPCCFDKSHSFGTGLTFYPVEGFGHLRPATTCLFSSSSRQPHQQRSSTPAPRVGQPTSPIMARRKPMSMEAMLDEERREVLALLEGTSNPRPKSLSALGARSSSPYTTPRSPVRSMLDIGEGPPPPALLLPVDLDSLN